MTEPNASKILPNLWLGNYKSSLDKNFLLKNNIRTIIRVTDVIYPEYHGIKYVTIPVKDKSVCDLSNKITINIFEKTSNIIKNSLLNGEGILVHCKRGHHRSAGIVCAFLIKHLEVNYTTSIIYVNNIRNKSLVRDTCTNKALYNYSIWLNRQ